MPYIIVNKDGHALRNLPGKAFNQEGKYADKPVSYWTFSEKGCKDGEFSNTIKKALSSLGMEGLQVVKITDDKLPLLEEKGEEKKVDEEVLFKELNSKCKGCKKECKQSAMAKILQCPQYLAA